MVGRARTQLNPVRLALFADAALELVVAVVLAAAASTWADLFNVGQAVIWVAAAVFLVAGLGIGLIAALEIEDRDLVWALAGVNVAGGILLWILFAILRDDFDPGAQWATAAVADSLILVGLLEIFALRWTSPRDE